MKKLLLLAAAASLCATAATAQSTVTTTTTTGTGSAAVQIEPEYRTKIRTYVTEHKVPPVTTREKIVIGENIVLMVVKIDRNQVRIGIEAPGHVPVFRQEILPSAMACEAESGIMLGSWQHDGISSRIVPQ